MASWEEFEQIHQRICEEDGIRTNLNQHDAGGGAGSPNRAGAGDADLVVGDGTLDGAARVVDDVIRPGTDRAGKAADMQTSVAAQYMRNWETASGVASVLEKWHKKKNALLARLYYESQGLRAGDIAFLETELHIRGNIKEIDSTLQEPDVPPLRPVHGISGF
ncbi:hypothetical protein GCM10009716_46760 [Streptomyces sodiiphilus]|uniref:Uncharacterized protein n=1 Tax=Streptomyces sodiiphilus TaxID=226217 RepID=A0ABN2PW11_9ACTN